MRHSISARHVGVGLGASAIVIGIVFGNSTIHDGFRLLLLLPLLGSGLTALAFARRSHDAIEWCVYVLGSALAVITLGGFALNATPWGLPRREIEAGPRGALANTRSVFDLVRPGWWLVLFGGCVVIVAGLALARREARLVRLLHAALWLLAGIVFMSAFAVAVIGATQQRTPGFSQLWITRGEQTVPKIVVIGIRSEERDETRFVLRVRQDGNVIAERTSLALAPGEEWRVTVTLPTNTEGANIIEGELSRADTPDTIYRRVILRP